MARMGDRESSGEDAEARRRRVVELALLFFRLGVTAFGGPAAHIAMMEEEVVRRRKWLTSAEFLDLLGATNLIPGPSSTEMAIHIGHRRAGWPGLVVAGACFIVPASLMTLTLAWAYVRFGMLPQAGGVLYGIKPVMIAVVAQALWSLRRSAVKSRRLAALGCVAAVAAAAGANELVVLLAGGVVAMALAPRAVDRAPPTTPKERSSTKAHLLAGAMTPLGVAAPAAASASATSLFFVFAKVGAVLFGSGYVLLAFLRTELVEHRRWLTESQLLDAIAVGQLTPGPVFTTATFVGYVVRGVPGAAAATAGIFAPAFVFVAASGALVPKLRASKRAGAFLDGVNVCSLALMAVVTVQLARASLVDAKTIAIAAVAGALLFKWKVNSAWLVLGGAAAGTVATLLG